MQAKNLVKLVQKLSKDRYTIMTYTGFKYEYLIENANNENGYLELLQHTDVLIDGKFEIENKSENAKFRGSTNQRAVDVKQSLKKGYAVEYEF